MDKNLDRSIYSRYLNCKYSEKAPNDNNRITAIRNKNTKKTQLVYQFIQIYFIFINTFLNEHNHILLSDIAIFLAKFYALPAKIKNNIKYFVSYEISDIHIICSLNMIFNIFIFKIY